MKAKKILALLAAGCLSAMAVPVTAEAMQAAAESAEGRETSGSCGENVTWSFDEDSGTLTISGKGAMDYDHNDRIPWDGWEENIRNVVIKNGVTSIGEDAFDDCYLFTSVTIPKSVTSIGEDAFYDCDSLELITIENPNCEIFDSDDTIIECTVRGYEGSTAQAYAEKYGYTFESLGEYKGNSFMIAAIVSGSVLLLLGAAVAIVIVGKRRKQKDETKTMED